MFCGFYVAGNFTLLRVKFNLFAGMKNLRVTLILFPDVLASPKFLRIFSEFSKNLRFFLRIKIFDFQSQFFEEFYMNLSSFCKFTSFSTVIKLDKRL